MFLTRATTTGLFLIFLSLNLYTQSDKYLITGRPSNTAGPYTVNPNMWHLESGLSITSNQILNQSDRSLELNFPNIDLRTGISEDVELSLAISSRFAFGETESDQGILPGTLGLKFNVYKSTSWLPNVTFSSKLILPVGSTELRPQSLSPSMKLIFAHFTSRSAIMYNLGVSWPENPRIKGNYAFMYLHTFRSNFSAYVEIYGCFVNSFEDLNNNFGLGLAYAPKENWQLDLSGGFDLSPNFNSQYLSIGYSLRFFTKAKSS